MSSQFRLSNFRASTYALFLLGSFMFLLVNPVLAVRIAQAEAVIPGVDSDVDVKTIEPKSDVDSAKQPENATTVAPAVAPAAAPAAVAEPKIDIQQEAAGLEALNEYMEDVELGLVGTSQDSNLFENALKKIAIEKKANDITSTAATATTTAAGIVDGTTPTSSSSVDKQLQQQQQQQQGTQSADVKQEGLSDYDLQMSQQLENINQFLFSESPDEIILNEKNDVKVISANKPAEDGATGAQVIGADQQEKGKDGLAEKNVDAAAATAADTATAPATAPATESEITTDKDTDKKQEDKNNSKESGEESKSETGEKKVQTSEESKQGKDEDKSGEMVGESSSKAPANLIQRTHKLTHINGEEQSRNWSYWVFGILFGGTTLFMLVANLDRFYKLLQPTSRKIAKLTQEESDFLAAKQSCEQLFNLSDQEALVF